MEQLEDFATYPLVWAVLALVTVVGTAAGVLSLIIALRQSARRKDIEQREGKLALPPEFLDGLREAVNKKLRAAYEEARLLQLEGYEAQSADKHREAIDRFTRALALAENNSQRAALHNLRGNSHGSVSEYSEAEADLQEMLKLADRISQAENAAQARAAALGNLGNVYADRGELDKAEEHHRQALEIDRKTSNRPGEAADLGNLGTVYGQRGGPGDLDKAEEHFERALKVHREIDDRPGEAGDLGNLGIVYTRRGYLDKAEEHLRLALGIQRDINDRRGEANQLGSLGNVCVMRGGPGDLDKAEEHYRQALEIHREIGNRLGEAQDLGNLGVVCLERGGPGDLRRAKEYLQRAQAIYQQIDVGGPGPEMVRRALGDVAERERQQRERGE
jgi:tetratricopeptide (TPR) repeat protein